MTFLAPRVSTCSNGDIEASIGIGIYTKTLTIDPRTGNIVPRQGDIYYGHPLFRTLVRAARDAKYANR